MKTWTNELPLFDLAESQRHADAGILAAAESNPVILAVAREIARRIAIERGEVTADDVQERLMVLGYHRDALGNAAGSLFRGREWQYTDRTVKSKRIQAHARLLRVWRYVG